MLEHLLRREAEPGLTRFRNDPQAQDRVPADFEEVVRHANVFAAKRCLPDREQGGFRFVARFDHGTRASAIARFAGRQCAPVDLAVRRQWQRRQHRERVGHERIRQRTGERRAQRIGTQAVAGGERMQLHAPAVVSERQHHAVAHARQGPQAGADFFRLDPIAADFHLIVATAEEDEAALLVEPATVARAVEACAMGRRIRHEPLRGQTRPAFIATRDRRPANADFTARALARRIAVRVEQTHLGVRQRFAQRQAGHIRSALAPGQCADRRLGRTVVI